MKRFDIVLANLDPRKGRVQSGNRPCLIVSSNIFNKYAPTLVVIPFTSTIRNIFPSECIIEPSRTNGLVQKSRLLGSQIITLDKNCFGEKLGVLDSYYHIEIENILKLVLDLKS